MVLANIIISNSSILTVWIRGVSNIFEIFVTKFCDKNLNYIGYICVRSQVSAYAVYSEIYACFLVIVCAPHIIIQEVILLHLPYLNC